MSERRMQRPGVPTDTPAFNKFRQWISHMLYILTEHIKYCGETEKKE